MLWFVNPTLPSPSFPFLLYVNLTSSSCSSLLLGWVRAGSGKLTRNEFSVRSYPNAFCLLPDVVNPQTPYPFFPKPFIPHPFIPHLFLPSSLYSLIPSSTDPFIISSLHPLLPSSFIPSCPPFLPLIPTSFHPSIPSSLHPSFIHLVFCQ